MERKNGTHGARQGLVKAVLAIMALGMLATGFILYMFAETLGRTTGTAEIIAIAFLAAGVMDYFLLVMWDRIFASKLPPHRVR